MGELEVLVRQQGKRQMQAVGGFPLVGRILCRDTKKLVDTRPSQFGEVVPKRARLRRASAGPRDQVPPMGVSDPRPGGSRIDVQDGATATGRDVDALSIRGGEYDGRKGRSREVANRSVVDRGRNSR